MSSHPTDTASDIVFLAALHLAATIGPDQWHRTRPQPIQLSVHLHLAPLYLDTPGRSDHVKDSLHYGHLVKAVERRVSAKAEQGYATSRALVEDVADAAFEFTRDAVRSDMAELGRVIHAVRVVLSLPKQILLAGGFQVELTTRTPDWVARSTESGAGSQPGTIVRVTDLMLPVLIGVNPPERLAKQRMITDITLFEAVRTRGGDGDKEIDYPEIVRQIATDVEHSTFLTLEKLAYEIIQIAYRASHGVRSNSGLDSGVSQICAITVRCQKPSALSFADASGIEMTRTWEAY